MEEYPHMVAGVTEEIRNCPHVVTGVQEEIPYCSPGYLSRKQKSSQFRIEDTPATSEADQIRLACQHLATNSSLAIFNNNNINRISKLPKSLTTTMPTVGGKSEKFELFEGVFQTSLKNHNQLTEEHKKTNTTPSCVLMRYKHSKTSPALTEILTVFRRKYVKPQSMATAKHKFQRLVFNPANQKLIDFLDQLQKVAKDAFGAAAQAMIEQFIYAKMPPHPEKTINQAHLENSTNKQIWSHPETWFGIPR